MAVPKIWSGSSWVTPTGFNRPRIWDGSTWNSISQPYVCEGILNVTVGYYTYTSGTKITATHVIYGSNNAAAPPGVSFGSVTGQVLGGATVLSIHCDVNSSFIPTSDIYLALQGNYTSIFNMQRNTYIVVDGYYMPSTYVTYSSNITRITYSDNTAVNPFGTTVGAVKQAALFI